MKFLRAIFSDFPLKLLALLLAFGIWHLVRADLVTEKALEFELRPGAGSNELVAKITKPEATETNRGSAHVVKVTVRGPIQQVLALTSLGRRLARIPITEDQIGVNYLLPIDFTVKDLSFPSLSADEFDRVTVVSMQPKAVTVSLSRIETKTVPVQRPEFEGLDGMEHVEVSTLDSPEQVTIRGAAEDVEPVTVLVPVVEQRVLEGLITSLGDRTQVDFPNVQLSLKSEFASRWTLSDPPRLEATLRITAEKRQSHWMPIVVRYDGLGGSEVRIIDGPGNPDDWRNAADGSGPEIRLPFVGVPARVDEIEPEKLSAFVLASELGEGGRLRVYVHMDNQKTEVRHGVEPDVDENITVPVEVVR